jgi:NADPH-dependent 2,4-dienoyl-CoA reductase/sulfur reductase-like enzyme
VKTENTDLDILVRSFADDWLRLGEPSIGERIVTDPVLVLGPSGTTAVPRAVFLAGVAARAAAVDAARAVRTSLVATDARPLGDRLAVATITWAFETSGGAAVLVSDFLLERDREGGLRCAAYLPRTNVLDHLG